MANTKKKNAKKQDTKQTATATGLTNLYATVRVDDNNIMNAFVTVVYPPQEMCGFGIPKVIVSSEQMSEEEIGQNLDEMAMQNIKWIADNRDKATLASRSN